MADVQAPPAQSGSAEDQSKQQSEAAPATEADVEAPVEEEAISFELSLHLPARPLLPKGPATAGLPEVTNPLKIAVTPQETLNDLRITITESPEGYWLGAFCFRRPADSQAGEASASSAGKKGAKGAAQKVKLGERVGEWIELKEVFQGVPEDKRELYITHVPFNEAEARAHVQRMKGLLSGGQADPTSMGIDGGISIQDAVHNPELWAKEAVGAGSQSSRNAKDKEGESKPAEVPFSSWNGITPSPISSLIPAQARPARQFSQCLRQLALSTFNPPPQYLRIQGHLLYLHIGTLEGENLFITASTRGFYINRSSTARFDPSPRAGDESLLSSSLFDLLCAASPLFLSNFVKLFQDPIATRDYFAILPLGNCLPAHPWLVRKHPHSADPLRNQTAYLLTGATSTETLDGTRDWNDEIQSTREMPKQSLSERLLRDRILNRTYGEFTLAAARAVPRVAAGEVLPMNPMDPADAQMYTVSNIFISKGADGVDIYPHLGGDEAAHVAVSKDLASNRALNNFDVDGLCLLGTVVVDWKGERWVAQSVVPGLFRRRDDDEVEVVEGIDEAAEGEKVAGEAKAVAEAPAKATSGKPDPKEDTQVVYGGVEGPEVIRTDSNFHNIFGKIARTLHLAEHEVSDAEGKKHNLWLSVDSKGLRGADGRKYALDLARLNPVDIEWLDNDVEGDIIDGESAETSAASKDAKYPHRMTLLRQELLQIYYDSEFRRWATEQLAARTEATKNAEAAADKEGEGKEADGEGKKDESAAAPEPPVIDASQFKLSFNPDAFVEFKQQDAPADAAPTILVGDEAEPSVAAVRSAAKYLRQSAIPRLVSDVASGLYSAQDGASLSRQLHARGINVRYLGHVARLCHPSQHEKLDAKMLARAGPGYEGFLKGFRSIAVQEMTLRASKRLLRSILKGAEYTDMAAATSHFLNCLLGTGLESSPSPVVKPSPFEGEDRESAAWAQLTPETLAEQVRAEVRKRFRFELPASYLKTELRKPQLLRELCQRCGVQLKLQDYVFEAVAAGANGQQQQIAANGGASDDSHGEGSGTKKNKKKSGSSSAGGGKKADAAAKARTTTFEPEDILCFVPVVKDSTPKSSLAEEAFETGRLAMSRGNRNLGVELLIEGVGFHEQVYNIVHPEVGRSYSLFATIVHHFASLAAVEHDQKVKQALADGKEPPAPAEVSEHLSLANALRYQRQAVTVSERTLGLDHPETLTNWMNLATLERVEGNTEASLRCQERVLELYELLYGKDHPDVVSALSNIALTLQNARLFEQSLKLYTSAHDLALKLFGTESIHTANMAHELSQAHTLCGDLKSALVVEKEALRVFEARLGKEDSQTRESEHFLNSLTASAVRVARMEKEEKAKQARTGRIGGAQGPLGGLLPAGAGARRQQGGPLRNANASAAGNAVSGSSEADAAVANAAVNAALGTESIDDLVAFIQGGGAPASARKGKAKAVKRAGKRG